MNGRIALQLLRDIGSSIVPKLLVSTSLLKPNHASSPIKTNVTHRLFGKGSLVSLLIHEIVQEEIVKELQTRAVPLFIRLNSTFVHRNIAV